MKKTVALIVMRRMVWSILLFLLALPVPGIAQTHSFYGGTCQDIARLFESPGIFEGDTVYLCGGTYTAPDVADWQYNIGERSIPDLVTIKVPNVILSGGSETNPDGFAVFTNSGINLLISEPGVTVTQLNNAGMIIVKNSDVSLNDIRDIRAVILSDTADNISLNGISIKPFATGGWLNNTMGVKGLDGCSSIEIIKPGAIHLTLPQEQKEIRITPLLDKTQKSCIAINPSSDIGIDDPVIIDVDIPGDAVLGDLEQYGSEEEARAAAIRSCFFIGYSDAFTGTRDGSENLKSPYCIITAVEVGQLQAVVCRKGIVYKNNSNTATGTMEPAIPDVISADGTFTETIDSCAYEVPGVTFVKWNTEPDGSGTSYLPEQTVTTDTQLVLYAIWWQQHTYQLTTTLHKTYDGNPVTFRPDMVEVDGGNADWGDLETEGVVRYVWRVFTEGAYSDMDEAPKEIGRYQLVVQEKRNDSWTDAEVFSFIISALNIGPDAGYLVTLPQNTTGIEANAFEDDANILSVYVPNGCAYIGAEAFKGCESLVKIRLPKDCQIDDSAFGGCSMLSVIAPAGGTTETWAHSMNLPFNAE